MKNGWEKKQIRDILQLEYGKPLSSEDRKPIGRYPVYGANGEKARTDKFYFDKPSIIVGRKGSAGEVNLTESRFWPLDVTYFVTFDDHHYDLRFLYYLLTTLDLPSLAKGVKPGINRNEVYSQTTKVPTLPEQRRIVGILDEAFAGIATAKANAERNLQNARALFESYLNAVFTQRGDGWVEKSFEDLVEASCSLSYGIVQPGTESPNGLPVVRPTDLTTRIIELDNLKRIDPRLANSYGRTTLVGGELLLCVRGSTGVVSIASEKLAGGNVTRGIVPIRFNNSYIFQEFGYYSLVSDSVQQQIREKTYGAALMQINIRDLRKIAILFPKLPEQKKIVSRLDSLEYETKRLETIYRRKLVALDELKKALLHQAFSGKL